MSSDGRLVLAFGPRRHDDPDAGLKVALRGGAVLGDPAQAHHVFTEMLAFNDLNDAQPTLRNIHTRSVTDSTP